MLLSTEGTAQSPAPSGPAVELPESRQAQLVTLRITHADGQHVGFTTPIKVRPTTTFEGDVTNLPLGASVWLAIRDAQIGDQTWRILLPPATADETGHWHDRVDVPCENVRNTCELMAFVSNQVMEQHSYDDSWFRQHAYKRTTSLEIRMLPRIQENTSAVLRIATVADTPGDAAQPIITPSALGVDGTSDHLTQSTPVWVLAQCSPSSTWLVLGQTTTGIDGTWGMRHLTLPPILTADHRDCALQAFSGPTSPPPQPANDATVKAWAPTQSARVQLIRNPYFLAITSITDVTGKRMPSTATSTAITVAGAAAAMEIEADQLPQDVRVWQLLRCDGCGTWLAFGPAELLESGRYLFVHPRFRFPARPQATRYVTMAVASRDTLEGRALTASDIAKTAVGLSRIIPVEHTAPGKIISASVTLVAVDDEPPNTTAGTLQSPRGLLTLLCKAAPHPPNHTVFVGYRDPATGLWYFHAATRAGEADRVLATIPATNVAPQEGPNSALVPVLAESLPTDRAINEAWWMEMTTAVGPAIPLSIPSLPWYRRASHWFAATAATISTLGTADNDDPSSQPKEVSMNWSTIGSLLTYVLTTLLLLAVVFWAWRHRMGARVVLNARLDARNSHNTRAFGSQPFERVIQAMTDAKTLAIQERTTARIAKLSGELSACEDQLHTTYEPEYERLKAKTGRHDASVALGATAHRILLVVLTVGESAFNLAVFYVFREPAVYTLLMALAIAVAIPICAFSVGLWVRR